MIDTSIAFGMPVDRLTPNPNAETERLNDYATPVTSACHRFKANYNFTSLTPGVSSDWTSADLIVDVKEVWGAGQQQVRNIWTNIAAFNLNLWVHTLVECWAWHKPVKGIRNRSDSPWDDETRTDAPPARST